MKNSILFLSIFGSLQVMANSVMSGDFKELKIHCDSTGSSQEVEVEAQTTYSILNKGKKYELSMLSTGHELSCERTSYGTDCAEIPNSNFEFQSLNYSFKYCNFHGVKTVDGNDMFTAYCSNEESEDFIITSKFIGLSTPHYSMKLSSHNVANEKSDFYRFDLETYYGSDIVRNIPTFFNIIEGCKATVVR